MRWCYRANEWLNTLLKPFGLISYLQFECDDDERGDPILSTMRLRDLKITWRPDDLAGPRL